MESRAAAGPVRTRSQAPLRPLGGAETSPAPQLPENRVSYPGRIAASGSCLGAGRGGACLFQGGGRASGDALLPAPSPKCHRGVGGRLQAEHCWP